MKRATIFFFFAVLPLVPVFLSSCAVNPVSGRHELMLLSEKDEIRLGRKTDSQVVRQYGLYEDKRLTAYLNELGQRLARVSHRPSLPYHFKIVDSPVVNAFAVPGGYVYITRGILAYLNSEAELAGVMGHEIGHITARHTAEQYTRATLAQLGLGLGMVFSDTFRAFGDLAQFGVGMMFLKFSRDNERQADDLGVEYASRTGYDASQLARFFETLERMEEKGGRSGLPGWFSTHPNPEDRIGAVRKRAREWQSKLGLRNMKVNRNAYLWRIDGLVFGEDPRQGYLSENVFYHPLLRFQFPVPPGWKLQNTRSQVRIISPGKDAVMLFWISRSRTPREAAEKFVCDSGASVIESRGERVNGLAAHRVVSELKTRKGLVTILSYFIKKDRKVYEFHGLCIKSRFYYHYAPLFGDTMRGFKKLTDRKKIHVKPARVRVRITRRSGTLRKLLVALGASKDKLKELAVLNGRHLNDRVPANTLLKIVEGGLQ